MHAICKWGMGATIGVRRVRALGCVCYGGVARCVVNSMGYMYSRYVVRAVRGDRRWVEGGEPLDTYICTYVHYVDAATIVIHAMCIR